MSDGWWWCSRCDFPNDNWYGACWNCGKEMNDERGTAKVVDRDSTGIDEDSSDDFEACE